jgi:hypothetical protein
MIEEKGGAVNLIKVRSTGKTIKNLRDTKNN